MRLINAYRLLILLLFIGVQNINAQNNVGIGTKNPDLTAILEIKDSTRGFLLPRTDTFSVENYVNTVAPGAGVTHGLTIYEVNMKTIYIYNGFIQKWQPISSLKGPKGPTGITGRTGPRGAFGIATQWRDSALLPPFKREPHPNNKPPNFLTLGDTCGDFYHQTSTGFIWTYDCVANEWVGPRARWRNFGVPDLQKIQATGLLQVPMPTSPAGNTMQQLGNLTYSIFVPPDTVAYVWITTEGNAQKTFANTKDYNKLVFDYFLIDTASVGSYLDNQLTIHVGPNFDIPLSTTSQFDKTPWEISATLTLEGKISPAGNPLPGTDYNIWTIQAHYGHHFMPGNTTHTDSSKVTLLDNAGSSTNQEENFALMSIYIVYERSRNAAYPY